jgi:hypothetical protein
MNPPTEPAHLPARASRGDIERVGLLLVAAGIVVALGGALLVRWQEWGARWVIDGFTAHQTYPWMWTAVVIGALISIVGAVTVLVGKAVR